MGHRDPKQAGDVGAEEKLGVLGCLLQESLGAPQDGAFPGGGAPRTAGVGPASPPPATGRPQPHVPPEKRGLPSAPSHSSGSAPATVPAVQAAMVTWGHAARGSRPLSQPLSHSDMQAQPRLVRPRTKTHLSRRSALWKQGARTRGACLRHP